METNDSKNTRVKKSGGKKAAKQSFSSSFTKNLLLIAIILIAGYFAINLILNTTTRHGKELALPDFSGMKLEKAEELAKNLQINLEVSDSIYMRGMEKGVVARQNPIPGSKVKKGRRILVVINSIVPRQAEVPSLIGYSMRQAKTELLSKGLRVGKLIYTEDMATNNVLAQQYNGEDIAPGTKINSDSKIDLVLGMNPAHSTTYVPYVIGYKYLLAKEILHDNSLNLYRADFDETVRTYSDSLEAVVYSQFPPASDSVAVRMGAGMTLYLSKDLSKIPVENDTDKTEAGSGE